MRKPGYLILTMVVSACAPQASIVTTASTVAAAPTGDPIEIVRVFDGDSLIVELDDGTEGEIRLLGINAPEGSECHGDTARQTLERLLDSGPASLVADTEDTDQFDRLLRYIYVDGLNVNLAMIASGDAIVLQGDHSLDAEFVAIADAAADSRIGMWAPQVCGGICPRSRW